MKPLLSYKLRVGISASIKSFMKTKLKLLLKSFYWSIEMVELYTFKSTSFAPTILGLNVVYVGVKTSTLKNELNFNSQNVTQVLQSDNYF